MRTFGRWITSLALDDFFLKPSCQAKFDTFHHAITDVLDKFRPIKAARTYPTDEPWMTKALAKFGKDSHVFKIWRNKVVSAVSACKHSFCRSKIKNLKNTNTKRCWNQINGFSGVSSREGAWHSQPIDGHGISGVDDLCSKIKAFYVGLTSLLVMWL